VAARRGWEVKEEYELVACSEGIGVHSRSSLAGVEGTSGSDDSGGSVARMADDEKMFVSGVEDDAEGNKPEFSVGIPIGATRGWFI
jgi:hypothetical protein